RYQVEFSGPPSMLPMIAASKDVYQRSHGLFNPALGELFALWHFQGEDLTGVGPPEPAAIAELMDNPPT
ncbi:MAG: FAD:protein FMN transferase, partial [Anaerolineae bacterium]|nr:FAD:protein FMN transferase [Anaerolineae bacterium]